MPNTITSKDPITALRSNDYLGVDDTSNAGQTLRATPEQIREYTSVGFGASLPVFSRKMAGVKTNANNCRVLLVGDSVTLGRGSLPSGTGRVAWNWGSIAQRYFGKAGITAQRDYMPADGDGTTNTFDSRININTSWGGGGDNSLGGAMFNASTTTDALQFTPTGIWDTCIVYYAIFGSGGVLSVGIDGGSTSTANSSGSDGIGTLTKTTTVPGVHTVNIKYVSGGAVFIAGVECYNSKISQLQIMTAGWGGATTINVADATKAYGPLPTLKIVAPDLTIIATGINDWASLTNITSFNTAYQAFITGAKLSGDVICLIPPPSSTGVATQANQDIYANAIRILAAANNIPVIDIYDLFQTYSTSIALYSDTLHPNGLGYEVIAEAVFRILNASGPGSFQPTTSIPLLVQTVANNTYTYVGYASSAGTVLGIYEKARALTTAGTFAITINGTNITGLSAVVPTTAGSYTGATALNSFARGDQITVVYTSTSLVLDHTLTLDIATSGITL